MSGRNVWYRGSQCPVGVLLRLLIQAGYELDVQDHDGWTPLHAAAHWGVKEACSILAEALCDMDVRNKLVSRPGRLQGRALSGRAPEPRAQGVCEAAQLAAGAWGGHVAGSPGAPHALLPAHRCLLCDTEPADLAADCVSCPPNTGGRRAAQATCAVLRRSRVHPTSFLIQRLCKKEKRQDDRGPRVGLKPCYLASLEATYKAGPPPSASDVLARLPPAPSPGSLAARLLAWGAGSCSLGARHSSEGRVALVRVEISRGGLPRGHAHGGAVGLSSVRVAARGSRPRSPVCGVAAPAAASAPRTGHGRWRRGVGDAPQGTLTRPHGHPIFPAGPDAVRGGRRGSCGALGDPAEAAECGESHGAAVAAVTVGAAGRAPRAPP